MRIEIGSIYDKITQSQVGLAFDELRARESLSRLIARDANMFWQLAKGDLLKYDGV